MAGGAADLRLHHLCGEQKALWRVSDTVPEARKAPQEFCNKRLLRVNILTFYFFQIKRFGRFACMCRTTKKTKRKKERYKDY